MPEFVPSYPKKFFKQLNSKKSSLYIDALLYTYQYFQTETLSFRSDFTDVVDNLSLHFEKEQADLVITNDEDDTDISQSSYKEMARNILGTLSKEEIGWFYIESEASEGFYNKYIEITPYASRLADFIKSIQNLSNEGFTKAIVDIYRNALDLSSKNSKIKQPYQDGLNVMLKDSNDLSLDLKRLNTDIRKFIQLTVSDDRNYETIMWNITTFANSPFLRDFSRFCNPENLIYYREETVKCLRTVLRRMNPELVMDCQLMHLENEDIEITEEEAKLEIKTKINQIIEFLQDDIQQIVNVIRRKTLLYTSIINQQLALKRNSDTENLQKKVEDLMQYIVKNIYAEKSFTTDTIPDEMQDLFSLNSLKYISEDSVYTPRSEALKIKEPEIQQVVEMTEEEIESFKQEANKGANNPFSAKKCIETVNKYLKDRESIKVSELPLETKEDLLKAVMIYLYADEGNYLAIEQEGEIKVGAVTIQNYIIKRRDNG